MVPGAILAALMVSAVSYERAAATPEAPECQGVAATIWGKSGTINGTSERDVIVGSDLNDTINGNSGDDTIFGEGGDDTVAGDAGNDEVWGDWGPHVEPVDVSCLGDCESNDDKVTGGTGSDLLVDFKGWNDMDGGAGSDDIHGKGVVKGGSGNDYIRGSYHDDILQGNSGNDDLRDGGGNDAFNGGSGRDDCDDVSDATSVVSCEEFEENVP
jgi:Ca2+-binding RTX toxin-like protein